MSVAIGLMALARSLLQRRPQVRETGRFFNSDSVAPILRWNLRKRPATANRRHAGESLASMEATGLTSELMEVLRERSPYTSRTAAKILGHMRTKGHHTAHA
jgi:hypothetical protein